MTDARVALVTGGSRGIGRPRPCATAAWTSTSSTRSGSPGTIDALVDGVVNYFGRLDPLMTNAAAGAFRPVTSSHRHHVGTANTIVGSLIHLARRADPLLGARGRLVAGGGHDARMAQPAHGLLGSAKAAVESLTRSVAVEVGPIGTTVNTVVPRPVDNNSLDRYLQSCDDLRRRLVEHTPIGRLAAPQDVTEAIAFLCSDRAAAVTGQLVTLHGGISAQSGP